MSSPAPVASAPTCALLVLLTACGGGGGGGGGGGPPPPGPVIGQASGDTPFAANCSPVGPAAAVYANAEVEPQVAVSPTNPARVLGAWQQDRHSDGGARGLVIGVSSDGGQTWARQALRASSCAGGVYERATDPWVAFGADGRAYAIALALDSVASVDNAILVFRSLDGGTTWGPATALIEDGAAAFNDKEAMAADPASIDFAYAAWDRLTQDNRGPAWFARTIDGGDTWEAARPIHDPGTGNQTINATPAVAPDGTVYVFFTEIVRSGAATVSTLRLMRSTDHGATFAAPITIGPLLAAGARDPNTGSAIRDGAGLGSIAIGPAGEIVVAWQDTRATGAGRDGVLLSRSTDRGDTWSAPVVVNRNTSVVAFTPAVAVRSDGRIGVTYFDMREDRAGDTRLDIGYWIVTSADGSSWSESRVAGPFDLSVAPMARGLFIGDYMGLATSGSSFVPLYARTNDNSPQNRTDIHTVPVGRLTADFEPAGAQALAKPAHLATPTAAEQRRSYDAIMRTLEHRIPGWPRRQAAFEAAAARTGS